MHPKAGNALVSAAACCGAIFLCIGTYLHPMDADPNVPLAAFAEYAASDHWITSHLIQLLGVIFVIAALVLVSARMADGPATEWAALGASGAVVSLALASALQAVDGVALKIMVDNWAAAPESEKAILFHAAFGVRQIEVGLASISSLLFGLTVFAYGVAFLLDGRISKWIGALAIVGGASMAAGGIAIAYTGFSGLAMMINMAASLLVIFWLLALAIVFWRRTVFRSIFK
jgi:hypothetical protein